MRYLVFKVESTYNESLVFIPLPGAVLKFLYDIVKTPRAIEHDNFLHIAYNFGQPFSTCCIPTAKEIPVLNELLLKDDGWYIQNTLVVLDLEEDVINKVESDEENWVDGLEIMCCRECFYFHCSIDDCSSESVYSPSFPISQLP
jgi:hypothetical protein